MPCDVSNGKAAAPTLTPPTQFSYSSSANNRKSVSKNKSLIEKTTTPLFTPTLPCPILTHPLRTARHSNPITSSPFYPPVYIFYCNICYLGYICIYTHIYEHVRLFPQYLLYRGQNELFILQNKFKMKTVVVVEF